MGTGKKYYEKYKRDGRIIEYRKKAASYMRDFNERNPAYRLLTRAKDRAKERTQGRRVLMDWRYYFLDLARLCATKSKDPSTKVGAVIVRPDNTICSTGYNGFPRGMSDDSRLYADKPTKYARIIHAEVNAILNAHEPVKGCTLYVTAPCCDRCALMVIQSGIRQVVYVQPTEDLLSRWGSMIKLAKGYFDEAGVTVKELPDV